MTEELLDLAYCAGYLDGDGCFYLGKTIQKPKNIAVYEYNIQVLSVKKNVLFLFAEKYGGFVREKERRPYHKVPYTWIVKGKTAALLAEKVYPLLIDKKIACGFFLEMSKTITSNNWKTIGEEMLSVRDEIIRKIREDRDMNNFVTKESIEAANALEKSIEPTRQDYAYLAGLIDSEGCFRVKHWKPKKRPNVVYAINLEIGNTKLPIIPWLVERFGGNVVYIAPKSRKRAAAIWNLSAKALSEILPKIHPFLTSKKEACEKLIEFQQMIIPNGGDRHSELFHALFEKNRARREELVAEIHKLNAKGS